MGHDGPLLQAYFAEQKSEPFFMLNFLMKIEDTKFR